MVKLTILYQQPADEAEFDTRYIQNLALLEKMPGIKKREACMVFGGPGGKSPFYRMLEFYFENRESLDKALLSPEGQTAGTDLMQFAGRNTQLIFSDAYED